MNSQPFNDYKNKGVEYDYVLQANVNIKELTTSSESTLLNLINNEDFMGIYFPQLGLGRVYSKYTYIDNKLSMTFGISLVDAPNPVTSSDLIKDIKNFIMSLNKNIEQTPKLRIKESDIKVDILSENKNMLENIDKKLVNESKITLTNGNNKQSLVLTSDGVVEKYINETLDSTMLFSKLGVIRECKSLYSKGYHIVNEAEIPNQNDNNNSDILKNPEQTKQELQQDIKDVDEIQDLKDELEDKLDTLTETSESDIGDYIIVVYTNIGNDYVPDVAVSGVTQGTDDGVSFGVADSVDVAERYTKDMAEALVQEFNDSAMKNTNKPTFIAKAIQIDDVKNIQGLYEHRVYGIEESANNDTFPSTEFTQELKTTNQLKDINLENDLTVEQLNWVQEHIGNVQEIEQGIINMANNINNIVEPILSLDNYFAKLEDMLKGE